MVLLLVLISIIKMLILTSGTTFVNNLNCLCYDWYHCYQGNHFCYWHWYHCFRGYHYCTTGAESVLFVPAKLVSFFGIEMMLDLLLPLIPIIKMLISTNGTTFFINPNYHCCQWYHWFQENYFLSATLVSLVPRVLFESAKLVSFLTI